MKKGNFVLALLVMLGNVVPTCAAESIQVVYNGETLKLSKPPIVRFDKVWLPARDLSNTMGYSIRYEKAEGAVYIENKEGSTQVFWTVPAGSEGDIGECPIILDGTTYFSVRDVSESFLKDVKWLGESKTVVISNSLDLGEGLSYDTQTGDFYNGQVKLANVHFSNLDSLSASKEKLPNQTALYRICNCYGEPHINNEFYSIYTVNGGTHIAESYTWACEGDNSLFSDHRVVLINKNVISVYDNDAAGKLLYKHTIDTAPLKAAIESAGYAEYADEVYEKALKGYVVEGLGENVVLYRNYHLRTLTLVNLDTGEETELYKKVYPEDEIQLVKEGRYEQSGDCLILDKVQDCVVYLKHAFTDETYAYKY